MRWALAGLMFVIGLVVVQEFRVRGKVRELKSQRDALHVAMATHLAVKDQRDSIAAAAEARISLLTTANDSLAKESTRAKIARQALAWNTGDLLEEVQAFDSTLAARLEAAVAERDAAWQLEVDLLEDRLARADSIRAILTQQLMARDSTIAEQSDLLHAYAAQLDHTIKELSSGFSVRVGKPWAILAAAGVGLVGGLALGR